MHDVAGLVAVAAHMVPMVVEEVVAAAVAIVEVAEVEAMTATDMVVIEAVVMEDEVNLMEQDPV